MLQYAVPPGYQRQQPIKRPKLGPWLGVIDAILEDDKLRPVKQRHTAKRIFERLREEHGFTGGYTIVKDYVRSAELHSQEMFIPLTHAPGEAPADFGEALVVVAGVETITTSPTYREAMKLRRCLVPADFIYEWQKVDVKTKQPYAIGMKDGSLFAFAGLWERWTDKTTGQALQTYTVITTDPNELMASMHNRMPVIVAPKDYERWLEPGEPSRLPVDLLRPYPAELMTAWKVSSAVGNVRNNSPELCQPLQTGAFAQNIPALDVFAGCIPPRRRLTAEHTIFSTGR
jgi:putative SOS response-associated peptidase YedK